MYFCTDVTSNIHKMQTTDWKDRLNSLANSSSEMKEEIEKIRTEEKLQEPKMAKQHLRLELDKSGRKGKQATLITGFEGEEEELKKFAAELKKVCGVGGSTRDGEILIQGDLRKKLADMLTAQGHKVKVC